MGLWGASPLSMAQQHRARHRAQLLGSPPNGQLRPKNSAAALLAATVVAAGAGGLGAAPGARLYKKAHKSGVDHQTCTFIARYVLFLDRVTRFGQTEQNSTGKLCVLAASEVSRAATQALANARGTAGEKAQLIEDSALFPHFFCYFDAV